jgi:hypothetical protein
MSSVMEWGYAFADAPTAVAGPVSEGTVRKMWLADRAIVAMVREWVDNDGCTPWREAPAAVTEQWGAA